MAEDELANDEIIRGGEGWKALLALDRELRNELRNDELAKARADVIELHNGYIEKEWYRRTDALIAAARKAERDELTGYDWPAERDALVSRLLTLSEGFAAANVANMVFLQSLGDDHNAALLALAKMREALAGDLDDAWLANAAELCSHEPEWPWDTNAVPPVFVQVARTSLPSLVASMQKLRTLLEIPPKKEEQR